MTQVFQKSTGVGSRTAFAARNYNVVAVHAHSKVFALLKVPRGDKLELPQDWRVERTFGPYDMVHMGYKEVNQGNSAHPELNSVPKGYFSPI